MEICGGNEKLDDALCVPGLTIHVHSQPYHDSHAGGDVVYVTSCGTGRIARVLLADVSGHGRHVAQIAGTLRDLMRRYINHIEQTSFMSALNKSFSEAATLGRFATAVFATYWVDTDFLSISNAGHPRPIWYRAKDRTWSILGSGVTQHASAGHIEAHGVPSDREHNPSRLRNLPFGIEGLSHYDELTVRLAPGDMVLLYTDALTEARDPSRRNMLGEEGLLDLLNNHSSGMRDTTDPGRVVPVILSELEAYRGGPDHPPDDDLTILVMSCAAQKVRRPYTQKVRALGKMAQAAGGRLAGISREPIPLPELSAATFLGRFYTSFILPHTSRALKPGEIRTKQHHSPT